MSMFKSKASTENDAGWKVIGTKPLIEISTLSQQPQNGSTRTLNSRKDPVGGIHKNYAGKLGESIKTAICNAKHIPEELFKKNGKILAFMDKINCS